MPTSGGGHGISHSRGLSVPAVGLSVPAGGVTVPAGGNPVPTAGVGAGISTIGHAEPALDEYGPQRLHTEDGSLPRQRRRKLDKQR